MPPRPIQSTISQPPMVRPTSVSAGSVAREGAASGELCGRGESPAPIRSVGPVAAVFPASVGKGPKSAGRGVVSLPPAETRTGTTGFGALLTALPSARNEWPEPSQRRWTPQDQQSTEAGGDPPRELTTISAAHSGQV